MEGFPLERTTVVEKSVTRPLARRIQMAALALALLASGVGIGAYASAFAQGNGTPVATSEAATTDLCPDELYGPGSEAWVRGELYFGTTKEDGTAYSPEEFATFLDNEITPRFPDGLTLLTGLGQWKGQSGIIQERSQLLIILYPADTAAESSAKLEEIRDLYEQQFHQESVLRADAYPVCTSF
jgi:hypothetical protein